MCNDNDISKSQDPDSHDIFTPDRKLPTSKLANCKALITQYLPIFQIGSWVKPVPNCSILKRLLNGFFLGSWFQVINWKTGSYSAYWKLTAELDFTKLAFAHHMIEIFH
ncbi:hypothetical protein LENED_006765 [Lentinula edodes]|uniref:Uncharacterized protein n=1 Tax=Lentinula edodes TaxID=5353 RepID=A0A1Q3ECN8_LENED|nr:hypothetical protein LENED_006765 [Lentinula edodes]